MIAGRRTFLSDEDYVRVAPDLRFPRTIEAADPGTGEDLYSMALVANWVDRFKGYEIQSLTLTKRTEAVTTAGLRTVAVGELFRSAAEILAVTEEGHELHIPNPETLRHLTQDESSRLLWAARIYALARAQDEPPLARVAQAFGTSQSTATRLIARARAKDLL